MNVKKLLPHLGTLAFAALLVVTQQVWAGPLVAKLKAATTSSSSNTINYQGYLTDATGAPVNDTLDMMFHLYNVASGGTALWGETQAAVPVNDGLFSVLLGSVDPLSQALFAQNDDLWLGIAVAGDDEMVPRDKIASAPYALTSGLPAGMIVMWSGTLATIPPGWALCDGSNGTPDLRSRFILGVAAGQNPGQTGGANSKTLTVSELPSHTHAFTTNSAGSHSHMVYLVDDNGFEDGNNQGGVDNDPTNANVPTTATGSHTHSGTTNATGAGAAFDIRPSYFTLAFIMKLP